MVGLVVITIVGLWAFGYFAAKAILHLNRRATHKKIVNHVNKVANEERNTIIGVEYKGYNIPMTIYEKKTIWDNLNKDGKKKALEDFKTAIKFGQITEFKN